MPYRVNRRKNSILFRATVLMWLHSLGLSNYSIVSAHFCVKCAILGLVRNRTVGLLAWIRANLVRVVAVYRSLVYR